MISRRKFIKTLTLTLTLTFCGINLFGIKSAIGEELNKKVITLPSIEKIIYIDLENGDDKNDGRSVNMAIKSLKKLNKLGNSENKIAILSNINDRKEVYKDTKNFGIEMTGIGYCP